MNKLSKEEREKHRKEIHEEALEAVTKSEQLNIRLEEANYRALYKLAAKQRKHIGTMVREWIIWQLRKEEYVERYTEEKFKYSLRSLEAKIMRDIYND
jgi:hypothetical protein